MSERVQQCRAPAQPNQHRSRKNHNSVSIWSFFPASHAFSTPRVWLFDVVLTAIFTHMFANKVSCRMWREWIVSWCDMHRLYNWYNAVEACTKTWHLQIWYFYFCLLTTLYTHCLRLHIISRHSTSFHLVSYHIISYQIQSYQIQSYHIISNHIVLSLNVIPWFF